MRTVELCASTLATTVPSPSTRNGSVPRFTASTQIALLFTVGSSEDWLGILRRGPEMPPATPLEMPSPAPFEIPLETPLEIP